MKCMKDEKQYRILVVDDESDLCEILRFNLDAAGYGVETALSAVEAMAKDVTTFDLLLLDVMMTGMSGFEMARQLKAKEETKDIPIIFLTALDEEEDKLRGFDIGADDYIAKPFSVRELMVRVRAVLRRTVEKDDDSHRVSFQGLVLNMDKKTVAVDGVDVPFTKTEFELLHLFIVKRGQVFSRQELIDRVWSHGVYVLDRTVDVNITRIRKKIGHYARFIATRPGFGYYFDA